MKHPGPTLRIIEADGPAPPSDDDLFLAAAAGNSTALRTLIDRHERDLRRFCRSILGDDAAASDAAQETFIKLWNARARYRAEGRFLAFLYTLARNTARSMVRRRAVRSWLGLGPETAPSPSDSIERQATIDLVSSALDRLPEKLRTPLVLRFIHELSYEEIALVIERTPSAARSRVHYGLKALKALLPKEVE